MTEYLLGHDAAEWRRLEAQHALWRDTLLPAVVDAGAVPGASVLEAGCGPGVLLQDLARLVSPGGRAVGVERDPSAVEGARARLGERADVRRGDLLVDDLEGPYDVVVVRWVLSFIDDVGEAVRRLAAAVKPGGALVVQDYDHDGLRLFPRSPHVERTIEAFRAAYKERGGDLWVAGRLPALYAAAGLTTEAFTPHVRAGAPDTDVFRWVETFLFGHLGTVQEAGHLDASERALFERDWHRTKRLPGATLVTPMQVTVVGRRGS